MKISEDLYKTFKKIDDCKCEDKLNNIDREKVISFFKKLFKALFLDYYILNPSVEDLDLLLNESKNDLLLCFRCNDEENESKVNMFFNNLVSIKEELLLDAEAIYKGDPSANNINEVILTFNPFYAISAYRVAHSLYLLDLKFIAKVISEFAHSKTGIDKNLSLIHI